MARTYYKGTNVPRTRNQGAMAMNLRSGDGFHGGGKRQRNKKGRSEIKQALKRGGWDA